MTKIFIALLASVSIFAATAQEHDYTLLLTGASFADPGNGWFESACRELGAKPLNRAVGGQSIADTATQMHDGTLYAKDELESLDALVIMHVHERNVFDDGNASVHEDWESYGFPFDRGNYTGAYDYVIKRFISDCYDLRHDPDSRYYGTRSGKPAVIVLCTHWHDGRVTFNTSVRLLAGKWGLPVVEFDRWIGFSKESPHPVTGEQYSRIFSGDQENIGGEIYGWHPERGESYIQKKMAAIFIDTMKRILPIK